MDRSLYPLCLAAEDTEASSRSERQSNLREERPDPTPAEPSPTAAAAVPRQSEIPTRPDEKDWTDAAALVMYFAMYGGC